MSLDKRGLRGALAVVLVALTATTAACTGMGSSAQATKPSAASRIPDRYKNWVVTYSTGAEEIRTLRLTSHEPATLVRSGGLDTGHRIHWLQTSSLLVFERLTAGKPELVKFTAEDGRQEVISSDYSRFLGVRNDREVLFTQRDGGGKDSLRSYDVVSGKRELVATGEAVLPVSSLNATSTSLFVIARSEPTVEPFDHVLHKLRDAGGPARVLDAPTGTGFTAAFETAQGLLYATASLGGDRYGQVVRRDGSGTEVVLGARGAILDCTREGDALLLEQPAIASSDGTSGPDENLVLKYVGAQETSPHVLSEAPSAFSSGRICGDVVLVASYSDGEHRLDAFDVRGGTITNLFHSPTTRVSEIETIDGEAAVCVLDTLSADGMVQESVMAFVPLDGGPTVNLDKTDSGFIHLARPEYCEN